MTGETKPTKDIAIECLMPSEALNKPLEVRRIDGHRYIFNPDDKKQYKLDDLAEVLLTDISANVDDKDQLIHCARTLTALYKKTDKWNSFSNKDRKLLEAKLKENPVKIKRANLDTAIDILIRKPQSSDVIRIKAGTFNTHRYIRNNADQQYYQLDQMAEVLLPKVQAKGCTPKQRLAAENLLSLYNGTDKTGTLTFSKQNSFRKQLQAALDSLPKDDNRLPTAPEITTVAPISVVPVSSVAHKSPSSIAAERLSKFQAEADDENFLPTPPEEGFNPPISLSEIHTVRIKTEHTPILKAGIESYLVEEMKAANAQGSTEPLGKFTSTSLSEEEHSKPVIVNTDLPKKLDSCKNHEDQQKIIKNFLQNFIEGKIPTGPTQGSEHCKVHEADLGIAWSDGTRPSMEDEHLAIPFDIMIQGNIHKGSLFGVFDGHNGNLAAAYVKEFLPAMLKARLEEESSSGLSPEGITNALRFAMVDLHEEFHFACKDLEATASDDNGLEGNTGLLDAGTTAVVMLKLADQDVYFASTGDARALKVSPDGSTSQVTKDANAKDLKDEIKAKGGSVEDMRGVFKINGNLSVGKAIGDRQELGIIPLPTITRVLKDEISSDTLFVLSCDGPFESVTHKGAAENYKVANSRQIGDAIHANKLHSKERSAKQIVEDTIKAGSQDNISLMIIGNLSSSESPPVQ